MSRDRKIAGVAVVSTMLLPWILFGIGSTPLVGLLGNTAEKAGEAGAAAIFIVVGISLAMIPIASAAFFALDASRKFIAGTAGFLVGVILLSCNLVAMGKAITSRIRTLEAQQAPAQK